MNTAPTQFLARMSFGLSASNFNPVDPEAGDFGADIERSDDHAVTAVIELPSGDTYRVTVEWLSEDSP